jgi:hypothetical protein
LQRIAKLQKKFEARQDVKVGMAICMVFHESPGIAAPKLRMTVVVLPITARPAFLQLSLAALMGL